MNLNRRSFIRNTGMALSGLAILPSVTLGSRGSTFTPQKKYIANPTRYSFKNELIRLPDFSHDTPNSFIVTEKGTEIPFQIEIIKGKKQVWICSDFAPNTKTEFRVAPGVPVNFPKKVNINKQGDCYIIDNGKVCIEIPAVSNDIIPSPIHSI
ncbi:MAG: DUF4861 domain-containing protein, partial [Mariniphaga sp.]|nr:DUF4861 domain-containing protein [Mariniphaga sp.]